MQQAWDRTSSSESVMRGHTKMLGKGQSGGYPPEATSELLQSISAVPVDSADKKSLQVGAGGVQAGLQQQNQQLLLTPASLQLAQLQAQLTLHRLKLAQGGNTASVLNQVLSNVAMSQPLFNQLRNTMVGNPQGAFPTGVLGFSSSNSALGALVGGGFNQNQGNVRLNHPGGGGTVGQQGAEYGKTSGSTYPSDTDRRVQYNLVGGTSAASATAGDGQYTVINTQAKNMNNVGFQRDFYGHDMQGQQAGFSVNEQNMNVYNSTGHKEQWKGPTTLSHAGKMDTVSNAANVWTAAGQPLRSRTELYNPEEPTPDPKFNPISGVSSFASSGTQGFGGYQPLHGSEETLSSGTRTLQAYQVNDYHAVTPTQLPHQCSICDKKVYNLKDWDQHVKGKLHLQNRTLYTNESSAVVSAGAVHYAVGRPSDGSLNPAGTNSMVYSAASQDAGANASYLPPAAMKTYPTSDTGFASHQPESKPFPPRKATAGRVVHICNLPEGSCTENDVINLGLPFGKVTNYILMRSTHQAFLEMAYVEAAQAMVQYYQLTPAMINSQKLLIRMSKRYKELQLKKPGKDLQLIIHDIASQRERDEMQEHEHYMPERARSRSPISRSLSPHSHSPSFTSCSSAHSPQGASCRGPERGSNGQGPRRGSWDWSSHSRRGEDERERGDLWKNGSSVDDDRPNGRAADRRKAYQKPLDHISSRSADERGGGGGGEGMRGNRDWHPRGSPQGMSFNSYRNMEDDFYMKEQMYKSDKPPRPPHQRHDTKPKRRDGGDYHGRPRHSEFEITEEPLRRTLDDKRQGSPGRDRSKKTSKRQITAEKHEKENATENTERRSKEKSVSPQQSNVPKESTECSKERETVKQWESGDDTDEECWYPKNMEELVTVDEVGGEDDSIIEPDLSELEEYVSCPKQSAEKEAAEEHILPPTSSSSALQEKSDEKSNLEKLGEDAGDQAEMSVNEKPGNVFTATGPEDQTLSPAAPELPITNLSNFPSEEFKAALEDTCLEDKVTKSGPSDELMENHIHVSEDSKSLEVGQVTETINDGVQHKDGILKKEIEAPSPSHEQDKALSEHSIPLGVEFIVPRTGFYCKLCGLFYNSEEMAKTTHCRSTVHYRNLQKYLSHLAEESMSGVLAEPSAAQ
ncbi:RNA-binding protein 20 isoform X2 [Sebastes umbrosus]|uniref:RNA-binding protein 20 isoform X2 n=1 Tax=Sebastes umbrosus TaxID=72105 RepID=UPI0018A0D088|nr:RNA-binding protein 20 isoform X2 [Sebastes umbrosus]